MRTPSFWQSRGGVSTLLMPLAMLYEIFATLKRRSVTPVRISIPVICVGNLTAGGAGKTPIALTIGLRLKQKSVNAFFLSRGYGGDIEGPVRVSPEHTARQVGDEPLLLAQLLPTIVCRDRVLGARFAVSHGAKAIVMDDGFQNPSLHKTLSIIVIDGTQGFGNGRLIPAGPLRESPEPALARAQAVIVVNPTDRTPALPENRPVLKAAITPSPAARALKGQRIIAFCGLAVPEKFFSMLRSLGAELVQQHSFADHHAYNDAELRKLVEAARNEKAHLVTTAKDAVRLPMAIKSLVTVVEIDATFERPDLMDALLDHALKNP